MPTAPPLHRAPGVQQRSIENEQQRNRAKRSRYDAALVKVRAMKLRRNPLCELCEAQGLIVAADTVHHIVDVEQAPELRLVLSNLQSLDSICHNRITAKRQQARA